MKKEMRKGVLILTYVLCINGLAFAVDVHDWLLFGIILLISVPIYNEL